LWICFHYYYSVFLTIYSHSWKGHDWACTPAGFENFNQVQNHLHVLYINRIHAVGICTVARLATLSSNFPMLIFFNFIYSKWKRFATDDENQSLADIEFITQTINFCLNLSISKFFFFFFFFISIVCYCCLLIKNIIITSVFCFLFAV